MSVFQFGEVEFEVFLTLSGDVEYTVGYPDLNLCRKIKPANTDSEVPGIHVVP